MSEAEVKVTLTVLQGDDAGLSITLDKTKTILGRAKADVKLSDRKISTRHAEIEISGSEVLVRDLESRNGVLLNGKSVREAKLANLDELQLGFTRIKVLIVPDLEAFKTRNLGGKDRKGEPEELKARNISSMIDDELKRFSKWDLGTGSGGAERVAPMKGGFGLEVLSGPDAGLKIRLERPMTSIGRGKTDISFHDSDVSRLHASIEIGAHGLVLIKDQGSTNGTFVNSKPVTEARLKPGDRIQVGGTICRFVAEE